MRKGRVQDTGRLESGSRDILSEILEVSRAVLPQRSAEKMSKSVTKDELKKHVIDAIDDAWESGPREVTVNWSRNAIPVADYDTGMMRYESGPTQRIEIVIHDPRELRRAEWI